MEDERLTARRFQQVEGLTDWRALAFGANAWFDAPSHAAGAALVRRVVDLTEDDVPDMDLRHDGVHVRISTQGRAGLTRADTAVAQVISEAAQDLGLTADPSAVQTLQLAIDALDRASVIPFWKTALGYGQIGDHLVDAHRRYPVFWFQQQDRPRPLRNRIHVDIARPHAVALDVADTVTTTGGRHTHRGEYYATLADAEGNEADIIPLAPGDELAGGAQTADWRVLFGAMAFYPAANPTAARFAEAVAGIADEAGFPLLIDLRPDGVTVDTGKDRWEHDRFGDLARRVQAAARAMDLTADPARLRFVQIGIDAVDVPAVREFWRAVLGYEQDDRAGVTDIYDPRRLNPPIFFQQMSASEEARRRQRNRIHVDAFVPDDRAQARIDRALAAGGRIVYDAEAPEWWTLADPEGNEIDVAVVVGREELWQANR